MSEMPPGALLDILNFGVTPTGAIAVPTQDTTAYWSNSFPLRRGMTFSWEVKLGGTGTKAVKIELEQGNQRPVTEGAVDTTWAVPDNKTATPMYASVADTAKHIVAYAPDATGYGRLKLTGLTGNDASTTLTIAKQYGIKTV